MSSTTAVAPNPVHRFLQSLLRGVELRPDAVVGAALRTPTQVLPVALRGMEGDTPRLGVELAELPDQRCVLTVMIDATVRIDLPVRLQRSRVEADGVCIVIEGVPLVLRRRVTVSSLVANGLAA